MATNRTWYPVMILAQCIRQWPAPLITAWIASGRSSRLRGSGELRSYAAWPMIVLRTPKGWTCPPVVDGQQVEGTFRAHQVPLSAAREDSDHRVALERWLRSYRPDELFDETGAPTPELLAQNPSGARRMSANPVANGGLLLRDLNLPDWRDFAVPVEHPGATRHEATRVLGRWLAEAYAGQPGQLSDLSRRMNWPATGCKTS